MDASVGKKCTKYFLAPLAVGLILFFVAMWFNREKPDIRFSLSGGLPRELLGETSTENAQLLEIRNIGKEEAKRLRIKINAPLTSYKLKKFSEGDKIEEFSLGEGVEIIYPTLPPQGIIRIILQSRSTVEKSNIEVSHSKGSGEEAFSGGQIRYSFLLLISFYSFVAIYIIRSSLSMAISFLDSEAGYDPNKILLRKKPLYVLSKRWNEIRLKALGNRFRHKNTVNPEKDESYKLLCLSEKIDYVTEEEWVNLTNTAVETLTSILTSVANTAWHVKSVADLLKIDKPASFPQKEWTELQNNINKRYFALKADNADLAVPALILGHIKQEKPVGVIDTLWDAYIRRLKKEYFRQIAQELEMELSPEEFLGKQDISVLSDKQIAILQRRLYKIKLNRLDKINDIKTAQDFLQSQRPDWIKDEDYNSIKKRAEVLIEYEISLQLLRNIKAEQEMPDLKPEGISEKKWNEILKLADFFKKMKNDYEKAMKEHDDVKVEKIEVEKLKEKIENQLAIIHNVLTDPKSIERIEAYSDVFAPGNFENLKKIAKMLSQG